MEIQCSSCQKRLKLPDNAAGKKIRCPICQNVFQVSIPPPEEKSDMSLLEPKSTVLDLPPETPKSDETLESSSSAISSDNLLQMIESSRKDVDKAMVERDEAMEMVDGIFQMFMERADNPNHTPEEQSEYREIAQKIFGLQRRFPLLSSIKSTLEQCEKTFKK